MRFLERLEAIARPLSELAKRMAEQSNSGDLGTVEMRSIGRRLVSFAGELTTLGVDMALAGDASNDPPDGPSG